MEERVSRLENLCKEMASSCQREMDQPPSIDERTLTRVRDSTASMRRELDALKAKSLESEQEVSLVESEIIDQLAKVAALNGFKKEKTHKR